MNYRSLIRIFFFFFLFLIPLHVNALGWHLGEIKQVSVGINYYNYSYLDADGLPVYKLGSTIKTITKIVNVSQREFKHTYAKTLMKYAEDVSGIRWWLDGQYVEYKAGDVVPGTPTEWVPAVMSPGDIVQVIQQLPFPLVAIPGKVYV